MKRIWILLPAVGLLASGCIRTRHEIRTEHKVEPIQVSVDVNLRVQRELNQFFDELDSQSAVLEAGETATEESQP